VIQPPKVNGKIIPIHDPCNNKHLRKSDIQLIGKDHRCITTRLKMLLPKLGKTPYPCISTWGGLSHQPNRNC